jgi:hypothetical protein
MSIVAQDLLLFYLLCAGEDLPPSDDDDVSYQWEIQTDEEAHSLLGRRVCA